MRRISLAAVAVAVLAISPTVSAEQTRPTLRILDFTPLTLAGRGFKPRETVKLVASQAELMRVRKARATAAGRFRTAFTGFNISRCRGTLVLRALGARGSRVTVRLLQPLSCPED
jgi:CelD/BcsL family acetyltransferase involved in cellulose biosynthesis